MLEADLLYRLPEEKREPTRMEKVRAIGDLVRARPDALTATVGGVGSGGAVVLRMLHNPDSLDIAFNTAAGAAVGAGFFGYLTLLFLSRKAKDGMMGEAARRNARAREAGKVLRRSRR